MDLTRFAALADAYGGTIARWPAGERAAARRLAATPDAARLLARADRLDARLDGWALGGPSPALVDAVARAAPIARAPMRRLFWWPSLAGLTLAGAAAGALVVATLTPPRGSGDEGGYVDTAFGSWEARG